MALSDLIAKILKDAKTDVAKIEAETAQEIEKIEAESEQSIKERLSEIKKTTELKKESMLKKVRTLAETERRNLILEAKQVIINDIFEKIIDQIVNLPEDDYEKVVYALFKKTGNITGAVFHPPKGKENVTIAAMKRAKMAYKQGASIEIKGGFSLISDKIEIDNSIETLVKGELKEKIQLVISKTLF